MTAPDFTRTLAEVAAAQEGDDAALGSLITRYYPWVRQTVALRLGRSVRNLADIEEVMQESMLDAFRSLSGFHPEGDATFRNWLARIVQNNVHDRRRRAGAEKRGHDRVQHFRDVFASSIVEPAIPAGAASPSATAERKELAARLEAALLQLDDRHREVILLRDHTGLGHEEIAAEMGLGGAAGARVLYFRAKEKLRAIVGGEARPGRTT